MSPRRRLLTVLAGTALVFGGVELIVQGGSHEIAAGALSLAAIAIFWSIILGALLDNRVERIERDVRRIANAIAPEPAAEVESPATPERLDRVTVRTRESSVEISWDSRDALLRVIRHLEWAKPIVSAFEAVGATGPAELDKLDAAVLAQLIGAIDFMGKSDGVPADLVALRKALTYPVPEGSSGA